jgi:hypothetical protein
MQNETITIEYSGVSRRDNRFGSVKTSDGRWLSCPAGMLNRLPKGATMTVTTETNEKGYTNIKGIPPVNSQTATQTYQAPVNTPNNTQSTSGSPISPVAGMAAMSVVGKLYQGTGQFPGRAIIAQQFLDVVMAWQDAEQGMKNYKDGLGDPAGEIPPF